MKPLYALVALALICGHASAADKKRAQLRPTRPALESKHQSYANAAGQIADQQKLEYLTKSSGGSAALRAPATLTSVARRRSR